jgi:ABC-type Fe3+ transport system substrate-binding protein
MDDCQRRRARLKLFVGLLFVVSLVAPARGLAAPDPKIIEAAKKEGQLVWYNTLVQPQAQGVLDLFTKNYPFIKATFWRGSSMQVYTKLGLEARAGKFDWDVVSLTDAEFVFDLKQKNWIMPYKSPERAMFSEDLKDPDGYWTGYYALPTGLGFNTRMVKADRAPRTYQDLLDPAWKGQKISIDTQGHELLVGLSQAWGKEKAVDYLKRLAAQQPVPGRGNNKRIELAAAGEFPLVVAFTHTIEAHKSRGAPLEWNNLEPVVVQVDSIMLGARAAHSNAGRLFIDFLLSQQGQELLQSYRRPTLRNGVEPNPPRLIRGYKRVVLHPGKHQSAQESLKLYRDIFNLQ